MRVGILFGGIILLGAGFIIFGLAANGIRQVNYCMAYGLYCPAGTSPNLQARLGIARGMELFGVVVMAAGVGFAVYGFTTEKRQVQQSLPYGSSIGYQTVQGQSRNQLLQVQQLYCGYCGKKVSSGASYYHNCGKATG